MRALAAELIFVERSKAKHKSTWIHFGTPPILVDADVVGPVEVDCEAVLVELTRDGPLVAVVVGVVGSGVVIDVVRSGVVVVDVVVGSGVVVDVVVGSGVVVNVVDAVVVDVVDEAEKDIVSRAFMA